MLGRGLGDRPKPSNDGDGKSSKSRSVDFLRAAFKDLFTKRGLSDKDVQYHTKGTDGCINMIHSLYAADQQGAIYLKNPSDLPNVQKQLTNVREKWSEANLEETQKALSELQITLKQAAKHQGHLDVVSNALDHLDKLINNPQRSRSQGDNLPARTLGSQEPSGDTSQHRLSADMLGSQELPGSFPQRLSPEELLGSPYSPDAVGPWATQRSQGFGATFELPQPPNLPQELPAGPLEPHELPGSFPPRLSPEELAHMPHNPNAVGPAAMGRVAGQFIPEGDGSYPNLSKGE